MTEIHNSQTNGQANGSSPHQTIDQVRELLFGAEQRTLETRITNLQAELAAARESYEDKLAALRSEHMAALERIEADNRHRVAKMAEAIEQAGRAIAILAGK